MLGLQLYIRIDHENIVGLQAKHLRGSGKSYLTNVLMKCIFSQELFIVWGLKFLRVNYESFDCDLT